MTATDHNARIFLIDDHPAVRKGLRLFLSQESHVICGEAGDTEETMERLPTSGADMALVDISLGDGSGLDIIPAICALGMKVLVYSMHEDAETIEKAIFAGADGYVSKREMEDLLLMAVSELQAGNRHFSPRIEQSMVNRVLAAPAPPLSKREQQLLQMLGQGDSATDMADALGISVRTIETHFTRICIKLNIEGMKDLRRFAIKSYR